MNIKLTKIQNYSLILFFLILLLALGQPFYAPSKNNHRGNINVFAGSSKENTDNITKNNTLPEINQVVVKFKDDISSEKKEAIVENLSGQDFQSLETIEQIDASVINIPKNTTANDLIGEFKKTGLVKSIEPNRYFSPTFTPNDPLYSSQWHHTKINSEAAWDSASGQGIIVAIADTGVNCNHLDLSASCTSGWNFYDDNADSEDIDGHGTGVAGAAAAIGNNANQVTGVAYRATIMPLKISDLNGYASLSDIVSAIVYAADNGAKVVNVSFGPLAGYQTIQDAAEYARSKGALVTISIGNSATRYTTTLTSSPIFISATDDTDTKTNWTSYGNPVDFSAPGSNILSTTMSGSTGYFSGTSFSAPITAGILGLVYSIDPSFTAEEAESTLINSADDLGDSGWDQYYGYGRVDAGGAVTLANNLLLGGDIENPTAPTNLSSATSGGNILLSWTASTDNVAVVGYRIYRDSAQIDASTNTTYTDTGATQNSNHTYTVRAYDAAGNLSSYSTSTTIFLSDTSAPTTPGNFRLSVENNKVFARWNTSIDNASGVRYRIYRDDGKNGYQEISNITQTELENGGLTQGKRYWYKIIAYDSADNRSAESTADIFVPDTQKPSSPQLSASIHKNGKGVDFSWTTSSDNVEVTRYHLYRDGLEINNFGGHTTASVDTSVQPGYVYRYFLRARDTSWNYSDDSNTIQAHIPDDLQITTMSVQNITAKSATIIWQTNPSSTGNISYGKKSWITALQVLRGRLVKSRSQQILFSNTINDNNPTSYHEIPILGLKANTTYYFQINTNNAEKSPNSTSSSVQSFTTARYSRSKTR